MRMIRLVAAIPLAFALAACAQVGAGNHFPVQPESVSPAPSSALQGDSTGVESEANLNVTWNRIAVEPDSSTRASLTIANSGEQITTGPVTVTIETEPGVAVVSVGGAWAHVDLGSTYSILVAAGPLTPGTSIDFDVVFKLESPEMTASATVTASAGGAIAAEVTNSI